MKYRVKAYDNLKQKVEQMSVDELLRSVVCPNHVNGALPSYRTPAMFLHTTTPENAYRMSQSVNEQGEHPTLFVADMEFGAGGAIDGAVRFPSMKAAAASGDKRLAYEMGRIAAQEAIQAGYHWTFGPCVDLLMNKENPIVGLRTAGSDADTVIEYAGAYMEGLQENGLIATLKHFPGDGCCSDDQHVTTTENPLSKEEWDASFGRIYKELIERGAKAIMPGHISLPAYDEADTKTGLYPPATVSKKLLTNLLREQMGFEGIIVSDAVNMSGFCGYRNIYHACADFLEAGGDCILFMHGTEEYIRNMKKCLDEKRLTMDVLKNRAYRMLCFAQEWFDENSERKELIFDRVAAENVAKEMTGKAVQVIRNREEVLPFALEADTRIAHVILKNMWVRNQNASDEVTAKLRQVVGTVDEFPDPGPHKLLQIAKGKEYDLIICSILEGPEYGFNTAKLCGPAARNMMSGWMRYETPVVFVGYDTTQFAETYKACVDTMIYTYGYNQYTADAVVSKLQGRI